MRATIRAMLLVVLSSIVLGQDSTPAPRLTLKDIEGRILLLSDYRGKVVLLNFWATWCAPCRAEMLDLVKWQREYQKDGFQVIGVTYPPHELPEVRKFTRDIKVNYPIVLGEKRTMEPFDKGEILPLSVVIDKKGFIHKIIQGIIFPEEFEENVRPLIK